MESVLNRSAPLELAQRCKMGDLAAMEGLALRHLELCPPETRMLLTAYESQPNEENRQALRRHLDGKREARLPAEAHMMWLLRAARFGSEHAMEQVGRLPYFTDYGAREHTNFYQAFPWELPIRSLLGRWGRRPERMARGKELRDIGFPDLPAVGAGSEFSITFWPSPGAYHVSWLDDYIPRDESGFGEESDYAFLWLDEFFCPMAASRPEEIPAELDRLDRVREAYWRDPARHATEWKYRRRLRVSMELPWGKPWEDAAPLLGVDMGRRYDDCGSSAYPAD